MDICVDFDGTVVTHEYPYIGKDIGAVPVLKELVDKGHRLILFTMRFDDKFSGVNYLTQAVNWFKKNDIPLFGIQTNPEQHVWTTSPKAYCQLILDDIALGFPTKYDKKLSNGRFADWEKIRELLIKEKII